MSLTKTQMKKKALLTNCKKILGRTVYKRLCTTLCTQKSWISGAEILLLSTIRVVKHKGWHICYLGNSRYNLYDIILHKASNMVI